MSDEEDDKPKGAWNGEACDYHVYLMKVTPCDQFKMYWAEPFIGQLRQIVEVVPAGADEDEEDQVFYLDNEDGSGLAKLYSGGLIATAHRNIIKPEYEKHVDEEHWNRELDLEKKEAIQKESDDYWREKDPETFAKVEEMKKHVASQTLEIKQ